MKPFEIIFVDDSPGDTMTVVRDVVHPDGSRDREPPHHAAPTNGGAA
ncbi:MAG: hypothetical protein JO323_13020 [Acidobacteriia bacterium]|nr:hypothetical protein [Terriglobia bacterium]